MRREGLSQQEQTDIWRRYESVEEGILSNTPRRIP